MTGIMSIFADINHIYIRYCYILRLKKRDLLHGKEVYKISNPGITMQCQ